MQPLLTWSRGTPNFRYLGNGYSITNRKKLGVRKSLSKRCLNSMPALSSTQGKIAEWHIFRWCGRSVFEGRLGSYLHSTSMKSRVSSSASNPGIIRPSHLRPAKSVALAGNIFTYDQSRNEKLKAGD